MPTLPERRWLRDAAAAFRGVDAPMLFAGIIEPRELKRKSKHSVTCRVPIFCKLYFRAIKTTFHDLQASAPPLMNPTRADARSQGPTALQHECGDTPQCSKSSSSRQPRRPNRPGRCMSHSRPVSGRRRKNAVISLRFDAKMRNICGRAVCTRIVLALAKAAREARAGRDEGT